jgi:hypothetical protein
MVAWLLVYPVYIGFLVAADTGWGAQSFLSEILFGSRRQVVFDLIDLGLQSAWIVLPVTAGAACLVAIGAVPKGYAGLGSRLLLVMVVPAATLAVLRFAPVQCALLATTLGIALLLPLILFKNLRHAFH